MPRMSTILVLLLTFYNVALMPAGSASTSGLIYVGCFSRERGEGSGENATISTSNDSLLDLWFTPQNPIADESPQRCTYACQTDLFRYAGVMKSSKKTLECLCGSSYGRNGIGQCDNCTADASQLCGSETAASVYDTNFQVPSPPQQIVLLQRTESALRISWVKPRAPNGELVRYRIHAQPVFSHSQEPLLGKAWEVSDASEQQQNLIGLLPGSQYNISVAAVNSHGASAPKSALLWTKIGVPDTPPAPRIIRQDRRTMTIELEPGHNTKGPISAYRIVVMDDTRANIYTLDHMVTWNESITTNHPYYVAAEFSPEDLPRRFVIGSESRIGMYFNGPLPPGHWHPTLGIVSSMEGFVETSYSISSHDQHAGIVLESNANPERVEIIEEDEMLVKVLWVAIGISGCILIACTVFYVGLKMNILPKRGRRRRNVSTRTENHQLTARESTSTSRYSVNDEQPEVYTHMGFIHDEDMKGKCLEKLQDVWYVPRNFMDIPSQDEQSVQLISKGKYGPVYLSNMRTNSSPVTLYSIPSSYFGPVSEDEDQATCTIIGEDPEKLFKDLDELIRLDAHENVVKLIGRMEDQGTMLFAVEYGGIPLKSLLLQYRQAEEKPNVSPYSLLLCAMNIAEGMFHLHSYQVTHGQLAACNVLISDLEKPKVTGFGLLASNPLTETLDFTRWLAVEQFQNRCVKPCDIWSFGVLLWEIATFGGTPYHDIRTEDFPKRICLGARPSQTEAIGDALYQIMLYCWQLDRDERPDFSRLSCSIHELLPHSKETLFFSPNFHNPPYIHQFEHLRK